MFPERGYISCSEFRNIACICPASRVLACLLLLALIASLAGVPPRAGDFLSVISHLGAKNLGVLAAYSCWVLGTSLHMKLRLSSQMNISLHWHYLVEKIAMSGVIAVPSAARKTSKKFSQNNRIT